MVHPESRSRSVRPCHPGNGHVVFSERNPDIGEIGFDTASGTLTVIRKNRLYWMDFPSRPPMPCPVPDGLEDALGTPVPETHRSRDLIVLVESEAALAALRPDMAKLNRFRDPFGFAVTAAGKEADFVSRFLRRTRALMKTPLPAHPMPV